MNKQYLENQLEWLRNQADNEVNRRCINQIENELTQLENEVVDAAIAAYDCGNLPFEDEDAPY